MKLQNPAPGRPITSPYGPRRHQFNNNQVRMHRGIDYGGVFNVLAAGDGVVQAIGANMNPTSGFGHWVRIDHGSRFYTVYAHGAQATHLKKGQRVRAGDLIFRSGTTGAATGPHLHFEVRKGSPLWGFDVDPAPYLQEGGVTPPPLNVTGREDRATWRAWQEVLKADWGYEGRIDGIPGPMTNRAIQRSVRPHGYNGPISGNLGPFSRRGVQQRLADKGYYRGRIDGIWGRLTWSALQRALNEGGY